MFTSILTYLVGIINYQTKIILFLLQFLLNQAKYSKAPKLTTPLDLDYRKLTVDDLPTIQKLQTLDYRQVISGHFDKTGKVIQPVRRHKNSKPIPNDICCPRCQAPHDYLYRNNGDCGQYQCKVCQERFNLKNKYAKEVVLSCPHCTQTLDKIKHRKGFVIYKCRNFACSFYQNRLKKLSSKEQRLFKEQPHLFKMHYLYRQFELKLSELQAPREIPTVVQLSNIHSSPQVLGLILTYYVNYGLSAEKTAALMFDVHQVKISGQTIRNYARSVACLVRPFTDGYPYALSDQFCGDETYIRVQGKWHYIYFFFDAVNKIILSHRVSPNRDTATAIKAFHDVIKRFDTLPENLNLIVDGNPIYKLAQIFFAGEGIHFDVTQVIGLTNEDKVSAEFRPLKQIIERLNRTFKGNYKPLGGFGSEAGSIAFVELFTTYFNFLRPHASLEKGRVPVQLPELELCEDMPQKWLRLLQISEDCLVNLSLAS
ncbi:hypothetical protein IGI37_003047 [Enterococcus sp. AZ194]|uniref:DDE-type integrase/transposase/recombinase n=1 Tax=Enterococcus sp. AZ194 TaxID=2774629 RepID=UPI003F1E4A54